jgi:hypothetical protein
MSIETVSSVSLARTLTAWAGRLIVGIATLHIVFFVVVSWDYLPGWVTGDLWVIEPFDAPISQSQAHFWALPGSFAVPLLVLGAVIVRSAREDRALPAYVTWTITAWIVTCALVLEPSGFALGLVPAGLLVAAEVVRRRT